MGIAQVLFPVCWKDPNPAIAGEGLADFKKQEQLDLKEKMKTFLKLKEHRW